MAMRVWGASLVPFLVLGTLTCAEPFKAPSSAVCPINSIEDSIFGRILDSSCPSNGMHSIQFVEAADLTEGDEVSLQKALSIVHKNSHNYVAVLFYASWCPFSSTFRPIFSILSSLYPLVPHFAIEESVIRPSTLSKYGVHGFPTLFLLNSTMRVRYHGSRTLGSLIAFYSDITGMKAAPVGGIFMDGSGQSPEKHDNNKQESCPFPWARSPENLFQQETYLALATMFVLLRLFYFVYPSLLVCAQFAWRRYIVNIRLRSLWEHPLCFLNRAIQLFNSLKEPCKRSNECQGMGIKVLSFSFIWRCKQQQASWVAPGKLKSSTC